MAASLMELNLLKIIIQNPISKSHLDLLSAMQILSLALCVKDKKPHIISLAIKSKP